MHRYIIKRIMQLIPVILGVSLLVFIMMDMAPGDILSVSGGEMSEEARAQLSHELGLDRSVFYRFIVYILGLLRGDLGTSFVHGVSVWKLYMQRLPATLVLSFSAILLVIVVSLPLGIKAATKRGTFTDNVIMAIALVGTSMPSFWRGMMLIILFSLNLGLLPSGGFNGFASIILPAITLAFTNIGALTRTTRSCMLDVLSSDYLRTARSKGVRERVVILKHATKNALIPIITVIGTQMGRIIGGAVITENVFSWPGVGRLLIDSIRARDTVTVTGCLIMTAILICIIQLLVDLLYAYVDPRLRSQYTTQKKERKKSDAINGGETA